MFKSGISSPVIPFMLEIIKSAYLKKNSISKFTPTSIHKYILFFFLSSQFWFILLPHQKSITAKSNIIGIYLISPQAKNIKLAIIITRFFSFFGTIKYIKSIIGKNIYKNTTLLNTIFLLLFLFA